VPKLKSHRPRIQPYPEWIRAGFGGAVGPAVYRPDELALNGALTPGGDLARAVLTSPENLTKLGPTTQARVLVNWAIDSLRACPNIVRGDGTKGPRTAHACN
jgi:hypothetical protein